MHTHSKKSTAQGIGIPFFSSVPPEDVTWNKFTAQNSLGFFLTLMSVSPTQGCRDSLGFSVPSLPSSSQYSQSQIHLPPHPPLSSVASNTPHLSHNGQFISSSTITGTAWSEKRSFHVLLYTRWWRLILRLDSMAHHQGQHRLQHCPSGIQVCG